MWLIPLACSTSADREPCDTKHKFQRTHSPAYRIDSLGTQTPLLNFFNAHPHHYWDVGFIIASGRIVHQGDTKNQV